MEDTVGMLWVNVELCPVDTARATQPSLLVFQSWALKRTPNILIINPLFCLNVPIGFPELRNSDGYSTQTHMHTYVHTQTHVHRHTNILPPAPMQGRCHAPV